MQELWKVVGRRQGVKAAEEPKGEDYAGEGKSKYVEFERGTHSQSFLS